MMLESRWLVASLALSLWIGGPVAASDDLSIEFEKFTLGNGLTVVVHQDHKAPIVSVVVWYHVGSKDEKPGKTGFAHLFEHLMFNGSENLDEDWFRPMEEAGATGINGTTNWDRTNYFENVPVSALDLALWMESDRMGHLLGAISQEKLDEQRGVVQNEKRQRENAPYGKAWNLLSKGAFPPDHPYSWPVIGSMEDLEAASLDDVKDWFKGYYGPSNALVVLSGDIDLAKARELAEKYFGDIPPGPPVDRHKAWIAPLAEDRRLTTFDQVPQARLYKLWNVAQLGHADGPALDIAAIILGGDKNSRLFERLVYRDEIATSANAFYFDRELSGWFVVQVDAAPGVELEKVEAAVDEELARLIEDGPTEEELERAKMGLWADIVRRLEGASGKARMLARGEIYLGDPGAYLAQLESTRDVSDDGVEDALDRWLSSGQFILEIHPTPTLAEATEGADRSAPPELGPQPDLDFPALERTQLSNGLEVVLAQRHGVPLVEMELVFDAGYAADVGGKLGTSSFTAAMLKEGTKKRGSLEIASEEAKLGASISARSRLDATNVSLSALKENLEPSLKLFADIVLNPVFEQAEVDRVRARWMARIAQEKSQPMNMGLRILPPLLYGSDHAYGIPLTGSGTEESIASLDREDLVRFHAEQFRPDGATLIIVGDTTLGEVEPLLEKAFKKWQRPSSAKPTKTLAERALPEKARVFLIDKPGAEQSVILAGQLATSARSEGYVVTDVMNEVLGGKFTARLNMNLREDKHWSYGAYSFLVDAVGQRPWIFYAPVQTDKTADAAGEILRELRGYIGDEPATQPEVDAARIAMIRTLPGKYERNAAVLGQISQQVRFDWPEDSVETFRSRVEGTSVEDVRADARALLKPEQLTWVVVGDLSAIEGPVRALGLGEVQVLDADGQQLR